ncbi:MAG: DUF2189 domain-containing protein [Alphaproteobacteria bacterium]|nr:DUF2189 domain-containing protein [Alphaproteobacteria bacterium]
MKQSGTAAVGLDLGVDDPVAIRIISQNDLREAFASGVEDFKKHFFITVPLSAFLVAVGLYMCHATLMMGHLQLVIPLMTGFALIAPALAIVLYELSRRSEPAAGIPCRMASSTVIWRIAALSAMLLSIFMLWLLVANTVYYWAVDGQVALTSGALLTQLSDLETLAKLLLVGCSVGFLFAVLVFCITVVSFQMVLEHDVTAPVALGLSFKAATHNPRVMAYWAAFIALTLAVASLPLLLGLVFAFPILGHSSWHLYRRVIATP